MIEEATLSLDISKLIQVKNIAMDFILKDEGS